MAGQAFVHYLIGTTTTVIRPHPYRRQSIGLPDQACMDRHGDLGAAMSTVADGNAAALAHKVSSLGWLRCGTGAPASAVVASAYEKVGPHSAARFWLDVSFR